MQSSYSDIILIVREIRTSHPHSLNYMSLKNKWEHVSDRALDFVLDHLNTLNDQTPKIRCKGRNGVDPSLIFGLETTLFMDKPPQILPSHNDEVETITVYRGTFRGHSKHDHEERCDCNSSLSRQVESTGTDDNGVERSELIAALERLPKESLWRVKGFVWLRGEGEHILNWAFGRFELSASIDSPRTEAAIRLTVMGERGEVKRAIKKFCIAMNASVTD